MSRGVRYVRPKGLKLCSYSLICPSLAWNKEASEDDGAKQYKAAYNI